MAATADGNLPEFALDEREVFGRLILVARGELDASTAVLLREKLSELLAIGTVEVLLDARSLAFVDSTGLSALIWATKQLRARGGDLTISAPPPAVDRVFALAGLSEFLTITRT